MPHPLRSALSLAFGLAVAWPLRAADLPAEITLPAEIRGAVAAASDLPAEPLLAKAREGLAKGVPDTRVASVVAALAADMRAADALLGTQADGRDRAEMLVAAARARKLGVSDTSVIRISKLSVQTRSSALRALADLAAQGLPEEPSVRLVESVAVRADDPRSIDALAGIAAGLLADGNSPAAVAEQIRGSTSGADGSEGWGAGGSKGGDPGGKGLDDAPGQQKK